MLSMLALVTGASKGIGEAIARELSRLGWRLILVARTRELLDELVVELSDGDREHLCFSCDLTDPSERERLLAFVQDQGLEISALVNNAGFGSNGAFQDQDRKRELRQIELNIAALVDLSHLFGEQLQKNNGYILNIASMAAFQPGPYMAVYYATKAFVLHFSEALAIELQGKGVSVTAHCPGATESEFATVAGNDVSLLFALKVMKRETVARHAVQSMLARKRVAVPGLMNLLGTKLVAFLPRRFVLLMTTLLNRPVSRWRGK